MFHPVLVCGTPPPPIRSVVRDRIRDSIQNLYPLLARYRNAAPPGPSAGHVMHTDCASRPRPQAKPKAEQRGAVAR